MSKHFNPCKTLSADAKQLTYCCEAKIKALVDAAVAAKLRELAVEEAAQWARCFGAAAPSDPAARDARIITIASARAALCIVNGSSFNEVQA